MKLSRPLEAIAIIAALGCSHDNGQAMVEVLTPGPGPCTRPWIVTPISVSVYVGDTTRFRAIVSNNCVPSVPSVRWSVGDRRFAAIDSITGLARGAGVGSTTIIATSVVDQNERAAGVLTVVPRP
jgi:hypothetical protein